MTAAIEVAAERLWRAWRDGVACAPVRDLIGAMVIDAAYAVQQRNVQRALAGGETLVGHKIGLTSEAVQAQLGVDRPDFGPLFGSCAYTDGDEVDLTRTVAPRIEAEIAFVLGRDLPNPGGRDDVAAAVDHAVAALEIVDSRIVDWDITIADTVADFASGAAFVLGSRRLPLSGLDLPAVPMRLEIDGVEVSVGKGSASLGDPLVAAAWLARELARRGTHLRAGQVVLAGALGPFAPLHPGQRVVADLGPLGTVRCTTMRSA